MNVGDGEVVQQPRRVRRTGVIRRKILAHDVLQRTAQSPRAVLVLPVESHIARVQLPHRGAERHRADLLLRGGVNLLGNRPANNLRGGRIDRAAAAAAEPEHSGANRRGLQGSDANTYSLHEISSGQVEFVAGVSHEFSFAYEVRVAS